MYLFGRCKTISIAWANSSSSLKKSIHSHFFFTNKIIFEWQNGAITCAKRPEEECEKPKNLCGKKKDGSRKRKKRKRKRKTKKTARKGRTRRRGKTKGRSAGLQLCTIYLHVSWSSSHQIQFSRLDDKDRLVNFFYTMISNVCWTFCSEKLCTWTCTVLTRI